jgi:hypothetical protein
LANKKNGPIAGAKFQEATDWWVMSGKAIQDAVPPAGTVREVTRRKSEGHGAEFAASLLPRKSAFAAPK